MEVFEITETVPTTLEYTEILTLIYNTLVEMQDKMDMVLTSLFFLSGILAGSLTACVVAYFFGKMMRGK